MESMEIIQAVSAGGDIGTMLLALAVLDLRARVGLLERKG